MTNASILEIIKEDFCLPKKNDPAFESSFELILTYPGTWAIIHYRIYHGLFKIGLKFIAKLFSSFSRFLTNIDIHPAATIGRRVFIDHGAGVVIGATTIIEDDVLIYQGVTLGGVSLNHEKRHPTIKSHTVIGSGAKVLGNITIGEHVKIGANSVVVRDVPNGSTAVGVPAKIIQTIDNNLDCMSLLDHNILPDISKEIFMYLLRRVSILEKVLKEKKGIDVSKEDKELEKKYQDFIKCMSAD